MKRKFDFAEFLLSVVKCGGYYGGYLLVNIGGAMVLALTHLNEDVTTIVTKYTIPLTLLVNAVFLLATTIFYNTKSHYSSFAERVKINPLNSKVIPYIFCLSICTLFVVNLVVTAAAEYLPIPQSWIDMMVDNTDMINSSTQTLQILTVGIIGPLAEEVLFRGLMLGSLVKTCNKWLAIIATALVFGLVHGHPIGIIYAFFVGILLGWLYCKTGSLVSVVLFHIVYNLLSFLMPDMTILTFSVITAMSVIIGIVCIVNIAHIPPHKSINENKDNKEE